MPQRKARRLDMTTNKFINGVFEKAEKYRAAMDAANKEYAEEVFEKTENYRAAIDAAKKGEEA